MTIISSKLLRATLLIATSAAVVGVAHAQAATSPKGAASDASTPSNLPPGATSARGNKAAVPASGVASGVNPSTGSTSGSVPGASSARGDKAATPKTPTSASAASAAR